MGNLSVILTSLNLVCKINNIELNASTVKCIENDYIDLKCNAWKIIKIKSVEFFLSDFIFVWWLVIQFTIKLNELSGCGIKDTKTSKCSILCALFLNEKNIYYFQISLI